jgi:hypothetical protein
VGKREGCGVDRDRSAFLESHGPGISSRGWKSREDLGFNPGRKRKGKDGRFEVWDRGPLRIVELRGEEAKKGTVACQRAEERNKEAGHWE